jgi:L,D-transpeptidase catalytic domain
MRRTLLVGFTVLGIGLVSACGNTDTAAPSPSQPTTATSTSTEAVAPAPEEKVEMPPLPKVQEANETITKTTPPPPPPPAGVPCDAGVDACVDLSANQTWLLKDGVVISGPSPITHGRKGFATPPGTFKVGWKDIDHKSSTYDDAPMPYSVFFNGGIAFHEGSLSEKSHGCIHLGPSVAKKYFNTLAVGDTVQVVP